MADKQIDSLPDNQTPGEKHIEQLIRLGGERDPIDPEVTERVRHRVYQAWRARQTPGDRLLQWFSAIWRPEGMVWPRYAAVMMTFLVLAGVILGSYHQWADRGSVHIADIDNVHGTATYEGKDLRKGARILSGDQLHTGQDGLVALRLIDGGVVKVDRNSRIRFSGRDQIHLDVGGLYFDSESAGHIRIHTARGTASDIGTRFETRFEQNEMIVRVRDGQVKVEQQDETTLVATGWSLRLAEGEKSAEPIPANNEPWVWADAMDEHFSFDGRSMAEVLFFTARKEGWQLKYQTPADRVRAQEDIVHGELNSGDSRQLLQKLAVISDMTYQLQDQVLIVQYP